MWVRGLNNLKCIKYSGFVSSVGIALLSVDAAFSES